MSKVWLKTFLFVILSLTLLGGCNNSQEDSSKVNPIAKAYWLIDEGQSEEAIDLLEKSLAKDPQSEQLRVALASAYASLADLSFKKFYGIAQSFVHGINLKSESEVYVGIQEHLKRDLGEQGVQLSSLLLNHLGGLVELEKAIYQIDLIPQLNSQQAIYAERAIVVLNEIPQASEGTSLFRGVLNTVFFKYKWNQKAYFGNFNNCGHILPKVKQGVYLLQYDLIQILDDFSYGLPGEKNKFIESKKQMQNTLSQTVDFLDGTPSMAVSFARILSGESLEGCH